MLHTLVFPPSLLPPHSSLLTLPRLLNPLTGLLAFRPAVSHTGGRYGTLRAAERPRADGIPYEAPCATGTRQGQPPNLRPSFSGPSRGALVLLLPAGAADGRGRRGPTGMTALPPPRARRALFQFLACALAFVSRQGWRDPVGPAVIMLYVIALSWMLMASVGRDDWYPVPAAMRRCCWWCRSASSPCSACATRAPRPCAAPAYWPASWPGGRTGRPVSTPAACCRKSRRCARRCTWTPPRPWNC